MDYARIKKMTIAHLDYIDLIGGKTGNPLAEIEVPQMLKDARKRGQVHLMDVRDEPGPFVGESIQGGRMRTYLFVGVALLAALCVETNETRVRVHFFKSQL